MKRRRFWRQFFPLGRAMVWLMPLWSRHWYLACGFVSLRQAIWRSFTRNYQEVRPSRYNTYYVCIVARSNNFILRRLTGISIQSVYAEDIPIINSESLQCDYPFSFTPCAIRTPPPPNLIGGLRRNQPWDLAKRGRRDSEDSGTATIGHQLETNYH